MENLDEKIGPWKADVLKIKLTTMYAIQEITRQLQESSAYTLESPVADSSQSNLAASMPSDAVGCCICHHPLRFFHDIFELQEIEPPVSVDIVAAPFLCPWCKDKLGYQRSHGVVNHMWVC